MRHGEVQVAGEGTAGAVLVELQVPHDGLSVGGTGCGRVRQGEVQVAGEGTAGALLVELQVPHDRLSVGGTVCGLLLSRLAFGGDSVLARTVGAGALRARVLVREAGAPGAVRAALG